MTETSSPPRLPVVLAVGSVSALMTVALALSFAILVYSGEVSDQVSVGGTLFLIGAAAMNFAAAAGSSLRGAIIVPQDATSAVIAVTMASVLPNVASGRQLGTVFAYTALATVATGVVMMLLGVFRLGNLVRLIPYPVTGGFLAGTGWLLVSGATDLATSGYSWSGATIAALVGAGLFALVLLAVLRFRPNIVVFPAMVIGGIVVFYLVLALTGTSIEEARDLGLLAGLPSTSFALPFAELLSVDWGAIGGGIGGLLTVPLVATLALLLNVSGLELVADTEADLNRELRVVGGGNLLAGLSGTAAGYHTLGVSSIGYRVGIASAAVPLLTAGLCLVAVAGGGTLVNLLPTPLVAGMLLLIGLSFLIDWLVDGRRQMTVPEYVLMLAITVAVALVGFLAAVLLGMAAAVALFAVAYSRVDPVRHVSTGVERTSTLVRTRQEREVLSAKGGSIAVVELQGYLFFGTARSLLNRAQQIVDTTPELTCMVIDLRRVQGSDSTVVATFLRLERLARRARFHLILSDPPADLAGSLDRVSQRGSLELTVAENLDQALEMAENHVLQGTSAPSDETTLRGVFGEELWRKLEPLVTRQDIEPMACLIEYGGRSDDLYLVDRGRIVVEIPAGEDRWQRVVSSGPGTVIGEMSVYLGARRSARIRADEPTTVYTLTRQAIESLERSDPEAAAALHRRLATVLAERLAMSNATVTALLR